MLSHLIAAAVHKGKKANVLARPPRTRFVHREPSTAQSIMQGRGSARRLEGTIRRTCMASVARNVNQVHQARQAQESGRSACKEVVTTRKVILIIQSRSWKR